MIDFLPTTTLDLADLGFATVRPIPFSLLGANMKLFGAAALATNEIEMNALWSEQETFMFFFVFVCFEAHTTAPA